MKTISLAILAMLFIALQMNAQQKSNRKNSENKAEMKTYLIERELPNAGQLSQVQLQDISLKSCAVIKEMRPLSIQWLHSYVTENKVYCLYKANNKELILEHAKLGGFPVNKISELSTAISPATAKN